MVEEGSGKGIQFAEGSGSWSFILSNTTYSTTIETNLDFVPDIIFCKMDKIVCSGDPYIQLGTGLSIYDNIFTNLQPTKIYWCYSSSNYSFSQVSVNSISSSNFTVDIELIQKYVPTPGNITKWYAIGVGEEDTTLRDSLASILEDEGVSVTEEDDMASLINKVDEEFNKDNVAINSLNSQIANKDNTIGDLNNTITSKNNEITNLNNQVDNLQQELEENKVIFEDYFEQMIVCRTFNGYREIDPTSLLIHPEVLISDVSYSSITRCWDGTKNRTFAVKNKILYELDDNMNVIKSSNAKAFYYVAAAYGNGQFKLYAGFIENEDSQVGIVDPESLIVGNSAIGRNGYDTISGMGVAFNKSTSTFEVYYVGDTSNSYLFKISEDASTATTINDIAQKTCRGVGVYYDESTQAIRLFTVDNQQGQVLEMSLSWSSGTIINGRMDPYDNEATDDKPKAVTTWYVKKSRMKYKGQYYYLN